MAQVATAAVGQRRELLDPHARIGGNYFHAPFRAPLRESSSKVPRSIPVTSERSQFELPSSQGFMHAPATATTIERVTIDQSLSSYRPLEDRQPAYSKPRAFFDVVLGTSPPAPPTPAPLTDSAPIKPAGPPRPTLSKLKQGTRKQGHKRKQPTPEESSEDDSEDSTFDESSDEDEPAPSSKGVLIMHNGRKTSVEPTILTSDVRGTMPDASCEATRYLFDTEYSTHKKRAVKRRVRPSAAGSSTRPPKPKVEAVRKSSRLATRSATPFDADSSVTDVSVMGSTRSVSVASIRNPTPKPKARPSKPKPAPRSRPGADLNQPAPRSTSIAHPPSDPPPPAPTNIVSLRPGYNAYTSDDKQWFLDFVAWVFRQNVHAGKAEICQDIFQQAPHHRLESWKSYWRDHISEVESLRNAARVHQAKGASHPRRAAALPRSYDDRPTVPRARPPPSSIASSESTDLSVRGSSKDTFYDSIKSGRRRTHGAADYSGYDASREGSIYPDHVRWALSSERVLPSPAAKGKPTARQRSPAYSFSTSAPDVETYNYAPCLNDDSGKFGDCGSIIEVERPERRTKRPRY